MTWTFSYDKDKVQLFTLHLIKSARKVQTRHVSRKRLISQLEHIRKLKIDKQMQSHVDELERRINELVSSERQVQKSQVSQDLFHRDIIDRITLLETKLQKYLQHHNQREKRFLHLEQKLYTTLSKEQKIGRIKGELIGVEQIYQQLVESKTASPAQLRALKDTIEVLKKRLKEIQNACAHSPSSPLHTFQPSNEKTLLLSPSRAESPHALVTLDSKDSQSASVLSIPPPLNLTLPPPPPKK